MPNKPLWDDFKTSNRILYELKNCEMILYVPCFILWSYSKMLISFTVPDLGVVSFSFC